MIERGLHWWDRGGINQMRLHFCVCVMEEGSTARPYSLCVIYFSNNSFGNGNEVRVGGVGGVQCLDLA